MVNLDDPKEFFRVIAAADRRGACPGQRRIDIRSERERNTIGLKRAGLLHSRQARSRELATTWRNLFFAFLCGEQKAPRG
jgi:hypothetical protein